MSSIILLQEEFLLNSLPKKKSEDASGTFEIDKLVGKSFEDRIAVLAIAYHNLGVEYDYLKQVKKRG